ncbi:MAG: alpha/beta hydrolase [Comamonadaceae bacterium]|nr:alpha/beta hydrolase [Comamonadaceae bacterium]
MKSLKYKASNGLNIAVNMHLPADFDTDKKYPAIIVGHPMTGVKEQAAGIYAAAMAKSGYVALAYDATYQGESEGEPRGKEDPATRVADFHELTDFLTTQDFVDAERIGVIGICASGGYAFKAAQTDKRIKAVAGVSPADVGAVFREGWFGNAPEDVYGLLTAVNAQRTAEAGGAEPLYVGAMSNNNTPETPKELQDGYEYYHTARGQHPRSTGQFPFVNFDRLIEFSSFDDVLSKLLTQPLLVVAGENAGTLWTSRTAYDKKVTGEKELFLVKDANHFDLYDKPEYVSQAVERIGQFFAKHL